MKIYFNANNKAHLEVLQECGVRNILLSHRYSYANITKFQDFDSVMVVAGTKGNSEKYWEFLKKKKEYYDYATQFDVYYNMEETISYYNKEREQGIDWTLPVLQENYLHHLSRLRLEADSYVCLGEIHGKLETEDQIRKLPANLRYHGLAKGKYIQDRTFHSIDTSAWISAAMSKKTEIWNNNTTYSMFFGDKGRGMIPQLRHSCEVYKDNMNKLNLTVDKLVDLDYYSLLKVPFALLFIPLCKSLGIYEENFNN